MFLFSFHLKNPCFKLGFFGQAQRYGRFCMALIIIIHNNYQGHAHGLKSVAMVGELLRSFSKIFF